MADNNDVLEQRLQELRDEYSKTKYNKATNKPLGILRHKIAEIRKLMATSRSVKGTGFFVRKSGDATVALLGFPSVGKSSIINVLTNTKSKTALYAFTTTTIIPGTMLHNDAHIQIFDMPGVIEGAHLGLGGGRAVIGAMKVSDLVVFVIDVNNTGQLSILLSELKALGVHINERRPNVRIIEQVNRGVEIEMNRSGIDDRYLLEILSSLGVFSAKVKIEDPVNADDLISIVAGSAYYMRAIVALNKVDTNKDYDRIAKRLSETHSGIEVVPISATQSLNIAALKESIYRNLDIMTVYLKRRDEQEQAMPVILRRNSRVVDAARKLHTEIADELKTAYVTGPSSRFGRQRVGALHVLKDGDTITFIKEK
jgi:ribosome-interacting GTPase 1